MGQRLPPEETAAPLARRAASLDDLRRIARGCRACPLWERGTQTVFGEGRLGSRVMFVGEQPGDQEDLQGRPFIGPAGRMLDKALDDAGIDRRLVYVTNTVKHFKWVPQGKKRIHAKPNAREIGACRPWLDAEIAQIKPEVLVCLGATAAQALLGRTFRVTKQRGVLLTGYPMAPQVMATLHPSSILRAPDPEARRQQMEEFFVDIRTLARAMRGLGEGVHAP